MSTQSPLNQPPAQCSTNWLTRLACKLQNIVEPLCEKGADFRLNSYEQNVILLELQDLEHDVVINCRNGKFSSAQVLQAVEHWQTAHQKTIVFSNEVRSVLAPRLTLTNKLGLGLWKFFSVGTECSCCWGLRLIVVAAFWFSIGYLTRGLL